MNTIDFGKVDAAFQQLANDKQGQAELSAFAAALDTLRKAMPTLNEYEAQYVASALLHQRVGVPSNIERTANLKTVSGFVIKSAVT